LSNEKNLEGLIKALLENLHLQLKKDILPEEPEYNEIMQMFIRLENNFGTYAGLTPQVKPATRYWEKALEIAIDMGNQEIATCLDALTPFLHWLVDPGYRGQNVSKKFVDNYACFELIGSEGLFFNSTVTVGVILLSPNIYYPPHAHPASECLYLLSGRGTWHISGGPIISIPIGGHMLIPSECGHAFWSMDTPLAAIYLCMGNKNHHRHSGLDLYSEG